MRGFRRAAVVLCGMLVAISVPAAAGFALPDVYDETHRMIALLEKPGAMVKKTGYDDYGEFVYIEKPAVIQDQVIDIQGEPTLCVVCVSVREGALLRREQLEILGRADFELAISAVMILDEPEPEL